MISLQGGGIIQESLGAIIPLQTGGFTGIGSRVRPAAPSPFGPAHTQKPGTSEYLRGDRAYCIAHGERARSTSAKTGTVVGSAEQARRTMLQIGVTLGSRGAMMARHFRGGKELEDYLTPPKRG